MNFFFIICCTISHKIIGLIYLFVSIIAGYIGYMYSVFIRIELSILGTGILFGDYQYYNVIITSHGLIMIFGFIMPVIMGGILNYFAPMMLGYPDMIFPRLNNISFWLFFFGFTFVCLSFLTEEGNGVGWTLYPTLICIDYHSSLSIDYIILAVHFLGFSSIINSLNVISTIYIAKKKFYSYIYMIMFVWSVFLTSILLILSLPVLAGAITMLLLDRNFNCAFYDVVGGGDLVLFQHLFWFFGHPEVYIIILPIFGLVSTIIDVLGYKCVFSALAMIYSMILIAVIGFFVWAHHMFVVGMDIDTRSYFGSITIFIGLPTSIKIFNWLFSFSFNDLHIKIELYLVLFFIIMFLIGGITGLLLANVGIDLLLHDTYFVVAHFHYVLSLGAVVGFFASICHFIVIWINIELYYILSLIIMSIIFFGSNFLFMPLHSFGILGFPRRISDYPVSFLLFNKIILIGILILLIVVIVFLNLFSFLLFGSKIFISSSFCIFQVNNFYYFFLINTFSTCLYVIIFDYLHIITEYIYNTILWLKSFYNFFWFNVLILL